MIPCTLFHSGEGEFRPYCGSPLPVWGPAGGLRTGFAQSDQQCPWSTSCISWQWCLSLQRIWGNLAYGELPCFSGDWLRSLKQKLSTFAIFQVLSQSYCFLSLLGLLGYLLLNSCFIHLLWSENICNAQSLCALRLHSTAHQQFLVTVLDALQHPFCSRPDNSYRLVNVASLKHETPGGFQIKVNIELSYEA